MKVEDKLNYTLKIINRVLWITVIAGLAVFLYCLSTNIITIEDIKLYQPIVLSCLKWGMGVTATLGGIACICILVIMIEDFRKKRKTRR